MSIHERINQFNNDIENKKNLDRAECQKIYAGLVQRIDELQLKNLFEEIKTDLWGMGNIKVREDTNFDTDMIHCISLSAEWPKYSVEHCSSYDRGSEESSYWDEHTVEIIKPSIDYQLYLSKENKTIIEKLSATKYTPKEYGFYIEKLSAIKYTRKEDEFYRVDMLERDISKSDFKHPTETDKNRIHNLILSMCAEQESLKIYPYTQLAEKDKKDIIKKLNSRVIGTDDIPPNNYFSYNEKSKKTV